MAEVEALGDRRSAASRRRPARGALAAAVALLTVLLPFVHVAPVDASPGDISTIAGTGVSGYGGDGGPATSAMLSYPASAVADAAGNVYVADAGNNRVRKITTAGIITTVAGTGVGGYSGDGMLATSSQLNFPADVAVDAAGNLYIADLSNNRIRRVTPAGVISTVAGEGTAATSGDGGNATAAAINAPAGIDIDGAGNLYIAEYGGYAVRKVTTAGKISRVAGSGALGNAGDGGAATSATFGHLGDVVVANGTAYISDLTNHRVRKVVAGVISPFAGTGVAGYTGDGGPATAAQLSAPAGLDIDSAGTVFVADYGNHTVRRVAASGTIGTVAGTGAAGYTGDGGAATAATLRYPTRVSLDAAGNFLIGDYGNHAVRRIASLGTPDAPVVTATTPGSPANANGPLVKGTAVSGTTVDLYTDAACSSPVAGTGTAVTFASPGIAVSVPDDSTTTFYATATDPVGTVSGCSTTSVTYVEDSTAPLPPAIAGGPTSPGSDRAPSWSSTAEAGSSTSCRLLAGTAVVAGPAPCTGTASYDLTGAADGTYTFSVTATDAAGNTGTPATSDYVLDTGTTPPAVGAPVITGAPPSPGRSTTPVWTFTTDPGTTATCELALGGAVVSGPGGCAGTASYTLPDGPDGTYTFTVFATDVNGTAGPPARSTYVLDTLPPLAPTIDTAPASPGADLAPRWTFTAEAGASATCELDLGGAAVAGPSSCSGAVTYELTGQPEGTYSFLVFATDAAGNPGPAARSDYTLDISPLGAPTLESSPPSPGRSYAPSWTFAGDSSASLTCQLLGGADAIVDPTPCSTSFSAALDGLPDGSYTFSVFQSDAAGNPGPAASAVYVLDTTAPATPTITASPRSPSGNTAPAWRFTVDGDTARSTCALLRDGVPISGPGPCTGAAAYDLGAGPDGTYTFTVFATDAAGNDSAPATSDFALQTPAPGTTPPPTTAPPATEPPTTEPPTTEPPTTEPPTTDTTAPSGDPEPIGPVPGGYPAPAPSPSDRPVTTRPAAAPARRPSRSRLGAVAAATEEPPAPPTPTTPAPPDAPALAPPDPDPAPVARRAGRPAVRLPRAVGAPDEVAAARAAERASVPVRLARIGREAAERGAVPFALIGVLVGFLAVQDRIDRNDPKLALAPVYPEPDLPFDPRSSTGAPHVR